MEALPNPLTKKTLCTSRIEEIAQAPFLFAQLAFSRPVLHACFHAAIVAPKQLTVVHEPPRLQHSLGARTNEPNRKGRAEEEEINKGKVSKKREK